MYKIVIDTKGSDNGAETMIKGAVDALMKRDDLSVLLVGDGEYIKSECERLGAPMERVEILDAPDEITNYDSPAAALFSKPDSSMVRGFEALGNRDDLVGIITAGNTGAVMAASVKFLMGETRVRPALCAVLPAENGGFVCLCDTGATIDCPASTLLHFARLGAEFMRNTYKIESPRVGLLSNGAESSKGNKVVKEAHVLLRDAEDINFIGNVEGNVSLSGMCDVLVCDGFAGNQVLKVTEGVARRMITDIVKFAKKTKNESIMALVGHLMGIYDISSLGGGIVLGCRKPIVKVRGNAGDKAVVSTSAMIVNMLENKRVFERDEQ